MTLRYERADDLAVLQALLAGASDYFQRISGHGPDDAEAERMASALPPGWDPSRYADKHLLIARDGDDAVGCLDLVRGYPDDTTAFLGFLLVATPRRRLGLGRAIAAHAEEVARGWGASRVRLSVVRADAPAIAFWEASGYRATGEQRPHRMGSVVSEAVLYEKAL